MTDETENNGQELLSKQEQPQADLSAFIPLAEKWIDGQSKQAQLSHEIDKEELAVISKSNRQNYHLLVIIIIGIFTIASGIIFYIGNLDAGLLVLSHVGAVVAGLMAGMGIQKTRTKEE
jgi:2-polyprenyl-3-methyl-5-hydroxy-6-metoxy-1,4-benzoquinol methylase